MMIHCTLLLHDFENQLNDTEHSFSKSGLSNQVLFSSLLKKLHIPVCTIHVYLSVSASFFSKCIHMYMYMYKEEKVLHIAIMYNCYIEQKITILVFLKDMYMQYVLQSSTYRIINEK